jgi:hypothetical protein
MFKFAGITHVNPNPNGHAPGYNFSLVGTVPVSMLEGRNPTQSDVMGGRVQSNGLAYAGRKWETVAEILEAAKENRVRLCVSATCSCRRLF